MFSDITKEQNVGLLSAKKPNNKTAKLLGMNTDDHLYTVNQNIIAVIQIHTKESARYSPK